MLVSDNLWYVLTLYTPLHFVFLIIVRYVPVISLIAPKWTQYLKELPFYVHYLLDFSFCYAYTGVGCALGYHLRRYLPIPPSVSDNMGLLITTIVLNSLIYSGNSRMVPSVFYEEFNRIMLIDLISILGPFNLGYLIASIF